jgi:hypothetical protein
MLNKICTVAADSYKPLHEVSPGVSIQPVSRSLNLTQLGGEEAAPKPKPFIEHSGPVFGTGCSGYLKTIMVATLLVPITP